MELRKIGRSDLKVSPLILGGNVFGWSADAGTSFAILDAFMDAGFNAVDTADIYSCWVPGHGGGESEIVIGNWLKARGRRERVILATKVGAQLPDWTKNCVLSAAHIIKAVEGSLGRLQTEYIDLYQSHKDDPTTPLAETLEAYDRLIKSGKVRAIGASHYDVERLSEASNISHNQGLPRYDCLQPRYNLCDRAPFEGALQDMCVKNDIGVLCYSSLAKGFLTGKYQTVGDLSRSQWEQSLKPYINPRGFRILAALEAIATQQCANSGTVALAWLIAQPGVTASIVAVNSVEELRELIGAATMLLDKTQIDALSAASAY